MTAKRFNYEYFDVYDMGFFLDNGKRMLKDEVLNTLNNLHEENKYLKEYNNKLMKQPLLFDVKTIPNTFEILEANTRLEEENEELKQELKVYRKVASCSNCKYHNYDWDIDDGYGGEEYEVCDKGNDVTEGICEDWSEL